MLLPGPEAQQLATYACWLLHTVKEGSPPAYCSGGSTPRRQSFSGRAGAVLRFKAGPAVPIIGCGTAGILWWLLRIAG
jgi:hypothetical protein